MKRPSFDELWRLFVTAKDAAHNPPTSAITGHAAQQVALRAVLAALPPAIELPSDEDLGRIARSEVCNGEGDRNAGPLSDHAIGAAIRAKVVKL